MHLVERAVSRPGRASGCLSPIEPHGCRVDFTVRFAFKSRLTAAAVRAAVRADHRLTRGRLRAARARASVSRAAPSAAWSRSRRASSSTCGRSSCRSTASIAEALAAARAAGAGAASGAPIPWDTAAVGVFGEPRQRSEGFADGDRIELYRAARARSARAASRAGGTRAARRAARSSGTSPIGVPCSGVGGAPSGRLPRSKLTTLSSLKYTTTWRCGACAQAAALEVVEVVPAVLVEHVRHHGRAEQVAHLRARHPELQLIDGLASR